MERMETAVKVARERFATLRTGRANPGMLDLVKARAWLPLIFHFSQSAVKPGRMQLAPDADSLSISVQPHCSHLLAQ